LTLMEALGGPRERVRSMRADAGVPEQIDPLNLVAIEPADTDAPARVPGLAESWFEHDGQITKWEVRAMTLAALAPRAGELLWDIGCGSGSVAIEWARTHPSNRAIAVDERAARAECARRNAASLGVPGVEVVVGAAPAALADLATPDAVFIGGGARDAGVLDAAWRALRPRGRCVVNAVTIETQALLADVQARLGGMLTRIAIERLDRIGPELRGFRPAMAVVQWAATKP
jgi:precorrin-6Y C5,15-methyltransferase (decarboxylating)